MLSCVKGLIYGIIKSYNRERITRNFNLNDVMCSMLYVTHSMLHNNLKLYTFQIFTELVMDVLMFPIWWYGRGFWQWGKALLGFLKERERGIGLLVWIKNVFRPMYGQTDWQGKLISFVVRLVQIIFRSVVMLIWLLIALCLLLSWLVLPIFVIYEILFQLI